MLPEGHKALRYLANVCLCNHISPSSCLFHWLQPLRLTQVPEISIFALAILSDWNIEFYLIPNIKLQIQKKKSR